MNGNGTLAITFPNVDVQDALLIDQVFDNGDGNASDDLNKLTVILRNSEDVILRAQRLAAVWRPCGERACWDNEPTIPPPTRCTNSPPTDFVCLSYSWH